MDEGELGGDASADPGEPEQSLEPSHRELFVDPVAAAEPSLTDPQPEEPQAQEAAPDSIGLVEDLADSFEPNSADARLPSNVVSIDRESSIDREEPDDMEAFLCGLIEALLFTSQRPLALKEIARAAGVDRPRARELLERLIHNYSPRGINIDEVAGGYVLRSSARYAPQIQKFLALRPVRLSRAQLETLAIVAYRQPVTKPEVDDIRGVDSGQVLKGLMERSLLKILGKKDEPGRPMLYGTTNDFLELLNLRSLGELPTLREYTELSDESRQKFADETGEEAPNELPPETMMASGEPPTVEGASEGSLSPAADAAADLTGTPPLEVLQRETSESPADETAGFSASESESAPPEVAQAAAKKKKKEEEKEEEGEDKDESEEDDDESDDDEDDDESDDDEDDDESDDDDDDDDDDDESEEDDDDESDDDDDDDDDDDEEEEEKEPE